MADTVTVVELKKPGGMQQDWPQPYEIVVTPEAGRLTPELPFLHKGDGVTVEDGTTYWITSAKQVVLVKTSTTYWSWIYHATRDASSDPKPWDEDDSFDGSRFGR